MYSSTFPLPLNPKSLSLHKPSRILSPLQFSKHTIVLSLSFVKSHICYSSNPDCEEFLWLREEQRWLREEQRWLREEQRWIRERESFLSKIQSLKLQIEALENRISIVQGEEDAATKVRVELQVLKDKSNYLIAESGSSARLIVLEEKAREERMIGGEIMEREEEEERKPMRKGSEGEEVKELQEALLKLGFYSERRHGVFQLLKWD